MSWVNVYLIDRAYGGPEEGGWWYTYGVAVQSIECRTEALAKRMLEAMLDWCSNENEDRRSDIGSVLSEGRYVAHIEDEKGQNWPDERPHYE